MFPKADLKDYARHDAGWPQRAESGNPVTIPDHSSSKKWSLSHVKVESRLSFGLIGLSVR